MCTKTLSVKNKIQEFWKKVLEPIFISWNGFLKHATKKA